LQSSLFIGEFREDLVQVRDFQYFFDIVGQSYNPHFTATFQHHHINAGEFADAGTVKVLESAQIQHDMLVAFTKKARDVFAEDTYFEKREMAANIDERGLWRVPDGGRKVQTDLPKDW